MDLSSIIGYNVKPYLEYGWVTAPNAAGQSITANTLTTLTIDTEVADPGGFGLISSNQITLSAGTYYFEGNSCINIGPASESNRIDGIFSLYNVTSSSYITRKVIWNSYAFVTTLMDIKGQLTIATPSVFELRYLGNTYQGTQTIGHASQYVSISNSTAGADQRTTIKLWKLA